MYSTQSIVILDSNMKTLICLARILPLVLASGVALNATAQLATIDITSPTNPVVTYDANPYINGPDLPDDPTKIYADALLIPTANDVTSKNTFNLERAALLDAGALEAIVTLETGQYQALAPTITTNNTPPNTYSLTPATSYYTAPTNQPPLVATANSGPFNFDFGTPSSPVAAGYMQVSERTGYSAAAGYGWGDTNLVSSRDRGGSDFLARDFCLPANTPFYLDLSNGDYIVSVLSGDTAQKSTMTVRANGMPELGIGAALGSYSQQSFPVTVTDGRLRLAFIGSNCHVNAITVTRDVSPHKPTIFVASDSTAAAYGMGLYPLTGWGDRIKNYLTGDVAVDDLAQAGRSSKSFLEEGWLNTIINRIHTNDFLFVMMAINDAASKDPTRDTSPETTFKAYLRVYVNAARSRGAIPVFVTSQTKRTYDVYGRFYNSVGGYPQAMREFGPELNVPVIDLNNKSINFLDVIGPSASGNVYMFFPSGQYPGWPNGDADYIHLQDTGATAFAKQVVDGIREIKLPIAKYVLPVPQPAIRPVARASYQ